jgi:PTS system cellobiose-specific IIB component
MTKILLVCSAGMSTSLLVKKMRQVAEKKGIEVEIDAVGSAQLSNYKEKIDVVLLGPQIRFLLNKIKAELEPKGIPVDLVNNMDYGTMNGENVLNFALNIIKKK